MGDKDPYHPHRQGSLDGLCGMYAIVNALRTASGVEADADEIFATACLALTRSRWPKVLWKGTGLGDMRNMIAACIAKHGYGRLRVRYPFLRTKPSSNKEFWEKLEDAFAEHDATCAIIRLNEPFEHWLVIGLDGGGGSKFSTATGRPDTTARTVPPYMPDCGGRNRTNGSCRGPRSLCSAGSRRHRWKAAF